MATGRMATGKLLPRDFSKNYPTIVRAEGVYLWDEAGNKILDASAGALVSNVGHGRPELIDAFAEQVRKVDYLHSSQFHNTTAQGLAEELTDWLPRGEEWHFFPCSGGSEAVESALKVARQYHHEAGAHDRTRFVSRETSYHGSTFGALAVTGLKGRRTVYEKLFPAENYPKIAKPVHGGDGSDAWELRRLVTSQPPESCAAFIAEPVSGASAPALQAGSEYYRIVRQICDENDMLLIADEVMSGLGRCGTPFALDKWGTEADVYVIGKGLGAGYVASAGIAVNGRVHERLAAGSGTFMHGFTYSAHPVTAAVSLEVLRIMEREQLVANSRTVGGQLLQLLEGLRGDHRFVGEVRGAGMLLGVDLVDPESGRPFARPGSAYELAEIALQHGVNVYPGTGAVDGTLGDHLLIGPPLVMDVPQAEELVQKLDDAMHEFGRRFA